MTTTTKSNAWDVLRAHGIENNDQLLERYFGNKDRVAKAWQCGDLMRFAGTDVYYSCVETSQIPGYRVADVLTEAECIAHDLL